MTQGVLLVDDDESVLKAVSYLLQNSGYSPHCTTSGEEALTILEQENIGLCFLDLRMPKMDGFEVCKAIKEALSGNSRVCPQRAHRRLWPRETKGSRLRRQLPEALRDQRVTRSMRTGVPNDRRVIRHARAGSTPPRHLPRKAPCPRSGDPDRARH